jgi:hypothetical protein
MDAQLDLEDLADRSGLGESARNARSTAAADALSRAVRAVGAALLGSARKPDSERGRAPSRNTGCTALMRPARRRLIFTSMAVAS